MYYFNLLLHITVLRSLAKDVCCWQLKELPVEMYLHILFIEWVIIVLKKHEQLNRGIDYLNPFMPSV